MIRTVRAFIQAAGLAVGLALCPQVAAAATVPSCFGTQVVGARADDLAAATVVIVAHQVSGPLEASGTAVVVRGSGDATNPRNRLVTAHHVVLPPQFQAEPLVYVYASTGVFLGRAEIVASGTRVLARNGGGAMMGTSDAAVLEMRAPPATGWSAYAAIQGLNLARRQTQYVLTGIYATPGGIDHGASGGPSVDDHGDLVAITSATNLDVGAYGAAGITTLRLGNTPSTADLDPKWLQAAWLPIQDRGILVPLGDPAILAALNGAGQGVYSGVVQDTPLSVRTLGFPHAQCVAYTARVAALDLSDPTALNPEPTALEIRDGARVLHRLTETP